MNRRIWVIVLGLTLATTLAAQTTYLIYPTPAGDGYFHDEVGSSYDYFDAGSPSVNAYYTYWGTSDTLQFNTGYMQFSLASLPAGAIITEATLNLYFTDIHYTSESPSAGFIKHVADSSAANGNASQRLSGSETLVELKDQADGWLTIYATATIQNDINSGFSYAAFSANPNTAGYFRDAGFTFNSADAATNKPYLSITVVPEPADVAVWIAALAASGAILWRQVNQRRARRLD